MSEMVERVARAIWEKQRSKIGDPNGLNARLEWKDKAVPAQFWDSYFDDSRAAISAMREPTLEMISAGNKEWVPAKVFRAMIDEILK
jgi:hypothetical protein